MRLSTLFTLLPAVLASSANMSQRAEPAPLFTPRAERIAGKYIVKFKDDVDPSVMKDAMSALRFEADHTFKYVLKGFAGSLTNEELKTLRYRPDLDFVEMDAVMRISSSSGFFRREDVRFKEQILSPWNLGRISHRQMGITSYRYDATAGSDTCGYVLDTGIDTSHPDFNGRATFVRSFDPGENDGNGHGTHCAGIIGSDTYGVAKKAKLFAVKVLKDDGSGVSSSILAGMDFVARDALVRHCPKGTFASLGVELGNSASLNQGAAQLVRSGTFLAVPAGDDNQVAASTDPATEPAGCIVGATDVLDFRSTFSNYGGAVDIFAPGTSIISTWTDGSTRIMSGTAMAAAHIAGLAAYLSSLQDPTSPAALCEQIQQLSTENAIFNVPFGTVNYLAYNGNGE